jgi:large subunit ribosomal protein L3
MNGLIGRKIGMSQVFAEDGTLIPVTVIQIGPCTIVQKKTVQKDGYTALQLGFGSRKPKRVSKPVLGHCQASGGGPFEILREFRTVDVDQYEVGSQITADKIFESGERVNVAGRTKGRGFSGVMKRHGMGGFPASHGTHEYFRHGGSIGNRSYPGRIFKGKRMPGHYGDDRRTTQNLRVVAVRPEENLVLIHGSVPGARGGIVILSKTKKG